MGRYTPCDLDIEHQFGGAKSKHLSLRKNVRSQRWGT